MQTKDRRSDIRVEPYRERYPFGLLAVPFTITNKDKPCRVQDEKRGPRFRRGREVMPR